MDTHRWTAVARSDTRTGQSVRSGSFFFFVRLTDNHQTQAPYSLGATIISGAKPERESVVIGQRQTVMRKANTTVISMYFALLPNTVCSYSSFTKVDHGSSTSNCCCFRVCQSLVAKIVHIDQKNMLWILLLPFLFLHYYPLYLE